MLLQDTVLRSIEDGTASAGHTETLRKLGMLVDDAREEQAGMLDLLDRANGMSSHLSYIVVLNLDCNFSCRYCFEGGLKGKNYMSLDTADALVEFISASLRPPKKTLNLDFYGGEPLLSQDLIRHIAGRLRDIAGRLGMDFTFSLVTNGTLLTKKTATELAALGLRGAKITLDGPRENHDVFRPFKGGAGSFDAIVGNIGEACGITKIALGGNYNFENYKRFPELLDYLLECGLTHEKIANVDFNPIIQTHNAAVPPEFTEGCDSTDEPWLIESMFLLRGEIQRRGYAVSKVTPSPCMVEVRSDFVVNFDGVLYKCPALIGTDGYQAGDVRTGVSDFREPYNTDLWKNGQCINCEYLPLCFGGCRYMTFLRNGRIDAVDCKKNYFDAALETLVVQKRT